MLTYRLPPILQAYREMYPGVELVIRGIGNGDLVPQLEQGRLDLGLVIDDEIKDPRLHVEVL